MDRLELTNQLLDYLQTSPSPPLYLDGPPAADLPPFDPYQMVGEWIALRQELKQQNKLLQGFQSTPQSAPAPAGHQEGYRELLPVVDALDRAIDYGQTQLLALTDQAVSHPPSPLVRWLRQLLGVPTPSNTTSELLIVLQSQQEGLVMIRGVLLDLLLQQQIRPILSLGQPFDAGCMFAVAQQDSADVPAQVVVQEIVRGYWQGDRVLREAQVVVAR